VAAVVRELVSVTTSPVGPAGLVSVTVPVDVSPPTTELGASATLATPAISTVSVVVCEEAPRVAVIVEVALDETERVVIVKVAVVCPESTVTDAGTVAAFVLELVKVTTTPPAPAALESVTVPVELTLPCTGFGAALTLLTS
jgi:hypothetical protein